MPKRHDKITKSVNYDYYWDILFCTVPLLAVSCFYYGARPLLMMAAGLLTAYVADCVVTPLHAAGYRAHEPSSEAFAALIVLMMPASAPYYMVVTATIIAVLVKEAFGGEGHYPFHPAAVGLVAATLAWPRVMSSYPAPGTVLALFSSTGVVLTQGSNTTLSAGGLPSDSTINLLTGNVAGPLGCCAILVIVACGLYLLVRGHMQLSTFVPYLAVCVLVPWLLPNLNELPALSAPWEYVRQRIYLEKYILLSGSMLFGGIFLACEPFDLRPVPGRNGNGVPLLQRIRNRRMLCRCIGWCFPRMAGPPGPARRKDQIHAEGGKAPCPTQRTVRTATKSRPCRNIPKPLSSPS